MADSVPPSHHSDSGAASRPAPNASGKRLAIFGALFLILSSAGTWVIYDQFASQNFSFDTRLLNLPFLLSAVALLCVYYVADGLRLHFTLRALGHRLALHHIFRLVFINLFFSNVTPMATGGGFAQIWYLQRKGVPVGTAGAATTIRTVLAIMFIFTVTPICLLSLDALQGKAIISEVSGFLVFFIIVYLAFFSMLILRTRWLIAPLSKLIQVAYRVHLIGQHRHQRWQYKARREMIRFAHSFALYLKGSPRFVWLSVFFTLMFLISLFSFPALLMVTLGYSVDYLTVIGLLFVTTFIMYFAPTPGASGISEGVFGSFFSPMLGSGHLVLVTVAWRFLTIYLGMIVGLVMTQLELARGADHRGAMSASQSEDLS